MTVSVAQDLEWYAQRFAHRIGELRGVVRLDVPTIPGSRPRLELFTEAVFVNREADDIDAQIEVCTRKPWITTAGSPSHVSAPSVMSTRPRDSVAGAEKFA